MFEFYIYSAGALSQSFINKLFILFDEKGIFLSQDLELICDMTFDNHLKCSGMAFNAEKIKELSYFQNIKKEKLENIETRIMGLAKIEINKNEFNKNNNNHNQNNNPNWNLKRWFFTCAINTLGHCEMGVIGIKTDQAPLSSQLNKEYQKIKFNDNKRNCVDFEFYKKCRLFTNNQFIGLSVKLINILVEEENEILADIFNGKEVKSDKESYIVESHSLSWFEKPNLFMIIGLTNGNLLIVKMVISELNYRGNKILYFLILTNLIV